MATAVYAQQSFPASTSTIMTTNPVSAVPEEQYITTFFCRALYDYQTQDTSSLSFNRNDVIEVLTRLESGWWDGLLGDERGWFPSNYVTVISDEEAEAILSGSAYPMQQLPTSDSIADGSSSTVTAGRSAVNGGEWHDGDISQSASRNPLAELANTALEVDGLPTSDFWMPQVTAEGAIFYVNTQTGQVSRDLPTETGVDVSGSDLAGFTASQANTRGGASGRQGIGVFYPVDAGFGLSRHTEIPEPWVRKLADDGMSYYFTNKQTGEIRWTVPEPEVQSTRTGRTRAATKSSTTSSHNDDTLASPNRLRSDSLVSSADRTSLDSDDSETSYMDRDRNGSVPTPLQASNEERNMMDWDQSSSPEVMDDEKVAVELTPAERSAKLLQATLSPPVPESLAVLSAAARQSIMAVIESIQTNDITRLLEEDTTLDNLVCTVVLSIRNLLYVSAAPSGHIPINVIPRPRETRDRRDTTASQAMLKPAQRKVTATLSKLVLSARAIQYNSGSSIVDTPIRIEGDAEELDRAVDGFVVEVQRLQNQQLHSGVGLKRLRGVFSTAHIGPGLVGAGAAGSWKGLGWVSLEETDETPGRILGTEIVTELRAYILQVQESFHSFGSNIGRLMSDSAERLILESRKLILQLSMVLEFVGNIHIARHVDIDGIRREPGDAPSGDLYTETVENARLLIRTLEFATQSLYDDGSSFLITVQAIRRQESSRTPQRNSNFFGHLGGFGAALEANLGVVLQTIEALLSIGHDQADMAQGDYNGSIEWRMSRLSIIDTQFGGAHRPLSTLNSYDEDVVDMELAFQKPEMKGQARADSPNAYESGPLVSEATVSVSDTAPISDVSNRAGSGGTINTFVPPPSVLPADLGDSPLFEEDSTVASRAPPRGDKLKKLLGPDAPQHYLNLANAEAKPWYLRPAYDEKEILIDPDGSVRGGTNAALVERLTAHEHGDPTFIKTYLMTYKSFTTLDELFDLLVKRFWIQPPDNLSPRELEEWRKLKQHVIQMRVINTFKSMVVDDDVLEKEDMYILNRMKAFISGEDVIRFAAAKQLLILIERAQRGGDTKIKMTVNTTLQPPPAPIAPKSSKKIKLLDIDSLELARQLTIIESQLYQKIRPMECLQRSREQKTDHNDNIAAVIQTSNRIANWVADSVLSREDSRRRAAVVKQFISVADRCRGIHNYSSMVAIISGLNSPPIRRLKRTWEQINARFMTQLGACEMTIDSNKNFTNYRTTLARVSPPCVPFIGVFLTTLTFVQDGSKDALPGNLINFRKRQKASEVIQDIKRWQSQPHNFQPLPNVLMFIEESLHVFNDQVDIGDHFWNLSLEREPREREDEKMARLLQESGFL